MASEADSRSVGQRHGRMRFGLDAQLALGRGFTVMERALGPTLGPSGTPLLMTPTGSTSRAPERIDYGATAAHRLLGIEGDLENTGMMIARHATWRQGRTFGDGTATVAVIAAAAHRRLARTHGASPASVVAVREAFDALVEEAARSIASMARPVDGRWLAAAADRSLGDAEVSEIAVDAVTRMGPDTVIVARDAPHVDMRLQLVDGSLWETTPASLELLAGAGADGLVLNEPAVLVWDADLDDAEALVTVLGRLLAAGRSGLLLVARSFSAPVVSLLVRNRAVLPVGAVVAPLAGRHQRWALDDIAALCGCDASGPTFGDRLAEVRVERLGHARRAIIGRRSLNVAGQRPEPARVREHRAAALRLLDDADDPAEARAVRERLGRLDGGMAIVWVGGETDAERAGRRQAMDAAILRLGAVVRGGAVPGGGGALLAAASRLPDGPGAERRLATDALRAALERPAWWIARNADLDPRRCVAAGRDAAPESVYDAAAGGLVDPWETGLVDPTESLIGAVRSGASAASSAISAAGVVLARRRSRPAFQP